MCELCRTVYLVAKWRGITPSQRDKGILKIACKSPCPEVKEFRTDAMRPYRVSENAFSRGYAREGEYELVRTKLKDREELKLRILDPFSVSS
jgi:hypothetical protein